MVSVSVGIIGHNPGILILQQLASVVPQLAEGDELILVDDCSSDGSMRGAYEQYKGDPRIRYVGFERNQGMPAARNAVAAESRNEYLVFCDSDDVADSHWLAEMRSALEKAPLVGSNLRIDRINSSWSQHTLKEAPTKNGLPVWITGEVYPIGAGFGLTKELFQQLGGFDETLRGHEDVDFGIRASRLGHPAVYCESAIIDYRLRPTIKTLFKQQRNYGLAGAQLIELDQKRCPEAHLSTGETNNALAKLQRLSPKQLVGLLHPMRMTRLVGLQVGSHLRV